MLRKENYNIDDVELFRRLRGKDMLDLKAVNNMIDNMIVGLDSGGYDFVVCDSVFNSVDSIEAESAVLGILNMLAKRGATVFFSGRKIEKINNNANATIQTDAVRYIEFLDKNGFSALYRKSRWFYQKFHGPEDVQELCKAANFEIIKHQRKTSATSWQVQSIKTTDIGFDKIQSSIEFEFSLPISDDRKLDRVEDVLMAARKLYGYC